MAQSAGVRRVLSILLSGVALAALASCGDTRPIAMSDGGASTPAPTSLRQRTRLDADWSFHFGDLPLASQVATAAYDDRAWRHVDLPHDYVIEGAYVQSDEKTRRGHGYLPVDRAWYRKRFVIPASDAGKVLRLEFDAAYRDSQVWLNGQLLGRHFSGFTPFAYDITQIAKVGGENVIAVRLDPTDYEGWFYEGAGLYRHIYLTATAPVHVPQWGTYVVATVPHGEQGADDLADVEIRTAVENSSQSPAPDCRVVSEILGPDGEVVKTTEATERIPAGQTSEMTMRATVEKPRLWSCESPNLYQLRTTVFSGAQPVDRTTTMFGIRTLKFDKDKGFFLNGRRVRIDGAASHQDFAGVGIAVPDSLQAWRVQQIKNAGANAWRCAHNPPNEALLDACDRMGILVMDENRHLGDAYGSHAPRGTIDENLKDAGIMVQRDRNHPSIIMWSLCNEEGKLQGTPAGTAIYAKMIDVVHQYDRTRPITSAMNNGWLNATSNADLADIIGVNYHPEKYDAIHQRHPDKMMYASETMNEKTTRGEYADDKARGVVSAYHLSEDAWLAVAQRPYMGGSFMWTGFDYKGEPNPYGWPAISNNTGLLDTCGFPKDKYFYFKSVWSTEPMVHLVPASWNWPDKVGQEIQVLAFSNAKRVELLLNGKSLGVRDVPPGRHAEWKVPYAPGELAAKALAPAGKVVATDTVQTTNSPARLQLTTDRTTLGTDGQDAVVVAVSLLDDHGRVVPNDDRRVTFNLKGPGRILGVGNGNPADHDPDKADNRNSFHGHCIAVIEAGTQPGALELTATSPGLEPARVEFTVH